MKYRQKVSYQMNPYNLISVYLLLASVNCLPSTTNYFNLSIIHINDFHASFEPTNEWGGQCKNHDTCIGGFSRMYQTIMNLKKDNPDSLILNAGDNYQGTIWYSIYKWNVTQYFLNKIPFDAYTLGNHEFDDTVDGAVGYMQHLKSPIVLANVDDSEEPSFKGNYKKSIVIERNGQKIGIIGVLLTEVTEKSKIRKLKFLDESESINKEAERLVKEYNVFTNIVLSHSGYGLEQEMARKATGKISIIVGGHTHSLLWTGENVPSKAEKPEGPYPTVVQGKDGQKVLVVQALSTARYVGNITLFYNKLGDVIDWSGYPIYQDSTLPQNEEINEEIKVWKHNFDARLNRVLGETLTELSCVDCRRKECTLGNFVADAMVFSELKYGSSHWNNAPVAFVNCGTLKETIPRGNITYQQLLAVLPFNNEVVVGYIKGKYLLEALEHALHFFAEWESRLLHFSGLHVTYDMRKPKGAQVTSAQIRCWKCQVPSYSDIVPEQNYSILITDFIVQGGDGFTMFKNNFTVTKRPGPEVDILVNYVVHHSPIWQQLEGRIKIIGDENIKSKYRRK